MNSRKPSKFLIEVRATVYLTPACNAYRSYACTVLALLPGDEDAAAVKLVALIHLNKFDDALASVPQWSPPSFEKAYCLYRLGRFKEATACTEALPRDERVLNLMAQIVCVLCFVPCASCSPHLFTCLQNFKARTFAECSQLYNDLISSDSTPDAELLVNAYAAHIAGGEPEKVVESHRSFDSVGETYELLFNKSCAEIALKDYENAALSLHAAKDICVRSMTSDGSSKAEIEKECASMLLQSMYLGIMNGKTEGSAEVCKDMMRKFKTEVELMAVAANNLAVLRGDRDLPDSLRRFRTTINAAAEEKLTTYQLCEIQFNRCVLLLHMRKVDECFRALDDLDKM